MTLPFLVIWLCFVFVSVLLRFNSKFSFEKFFIMKLNILNNYCHTKWVWILTVMMIWWWPNLLPKKMIQRWPDRAVMWSLRNFFGIRNMSVDRAVFTSEKSFLEISLKLSDLKGLPENSTFTSNAVALNGRQYFLKAMFANCRFEIAC